MSLNATTSTLAPVPAETARPSEPVAVKRQIRGSSLLMVGRLSTKGVNFAVQVLIVRYLSQTDYGALAYALSIVAMARALTTFGLDRAISRFLPIYQEREEYGKLFGTVFMVVGTIVSIGIGMALLLYGLQGLVEAYWISDERALTLLLLLVFLAPVQAIDEVLVGMFAVFAKPRSIFFRKYVLAPGLKLSVVLVCVLGSANVVFLAGGYLVAAVLGVAICALLLWRTLSEQGIFQYFDSRTVAVPWREVLLFTVPLLTSDLVYVVMHTMDAIVLERYADITQVAALRAVQPLAMLNQLVMASFATLFTPMAARMFARKDREGINDLYWRTAIWIAVCTFPIFAVTFAISEPITVLLFGVRYQQSATILAVLALGCYFHAALGFNGLTLKVYGKLKYIVTINVLAAMLNFVAIVLLIPRFGALGAALGTCGTLLVHNILKQVGLGLGTGIHLFDWRYVRVYLVISLAASGLWVVQQVAAAPVYISLALAGLVSLLVFRINRRLLNAHQIFPELLRIPLVRQLVAD